MTNRPKLIHLQAKLIRYPAKLPAKFRATVMDLRQVLVSALGLDPDLVGHSRVALSTKLAHLSRSHFGY